jgi:hypothetical protein
MNIRRIISVGWLPLAAASAIMTWPTTAVSSPIVSTDSAVFVERKGGDSDRQLEPAERFVRGDRVITILRWHRLGGNGGFTITNPLPRTIAFQRSSRSDEQVSVDGGKTWGRLSELTVGSRVASPEDVTHVRWKISPQRALEGSGQIAYSAIVR